LSEDTVLKWYRDSHSAKGKMHFLEKMRPFIEWLQNAEEGNLFFCNFGYSKFNIFILSCNRRKWLRRRRIRIEIEIQDKMKQTTSSSKNIENLHTLKKEESGHLLF
jgi:hypothetical protein